MDDAISRQAVLKLLSAMPPEDATTKALLIQSVKQMDAAQPECAKDFVMLKVIDLNGRPYYSIIYLENGNEFEGYSSYDLKVISEYLKRYFGFAQPETHDKRTESHACDLISRQAVLKLLATMSPEEAMTKALLIQGVKQMDAAQPERKRGKWEIYVISMFDGEGCRCSECGLEGVTYWDFCPNCGADMRGEQG